MAFSDRLKEFIDQSVQASKDVASKAGAKAQELGEKGVLKLEISQLEGRLTKQVSRLGTEAYKVFVEQGAATLSADDGVVKAILDEIDRIRADIERKEAEYKTKGA